MNLCRIAALGTALLALAGCTNARLVRVCDPCGCRCVAEPVLTEKGEIPRGEEGAASATQEQGSAAPRSDLDVKHQLAGKQIRGLAWDGLDLDQAVAYLGTVSGVDFVLSPKVRNEKFEDVQITLHADDVSVRQVLDIVTRPYELRWEVRDTVVHVLTREELDGSVRLRYYDVKDIFAKPVVTAGQPTPAPVASAAEETALLDEIRGEVHPRYWQGADAAIELRNGILIARAPKAVHEAVDEFLTKKRRARKPYGMPPEVTKRLETTTVNLAVEDETLGDVVGTLQMQTGMNLWIDPRLAPDVKKTRIVGMKQKDTALSTVLNMLAAACAEDAVWVAKGNVLTLTRTEYVEDGQ